MSFCGRKSLSLVGGQCRWRFLTALEICEICEIFSSKTLPTKRTAFIQFLSTTIRSNPQTKSEMERIAGSKIGQEISFVCVWKPSTVAPDYIYQQEDVSGFEYYFLEGQFGSAKC